MVGNRRRLAGPLLEWNDDAGNHAIGIRDAMLGAIGVDLGIGLHVVLDDHGEHPTAGPVPGLDRL
jgi:hypothetical protein